MTPCRMRCVDLNSEREREIKDEEKKHKGSDPQQKYESGTPKPPKEGGEGVTGLLCCCWQPNADGAEGQVDGPKKVANKKRIH